MPNYEFRLVGEEDALETRELDSEPTPEEDILIEGSIYRVDAVETTRWGKPNVVYVRKTIGI